MIIAKAPLRISIGGGGTDLPSYFENHGTTFSSLAIDKYVYIALNKRFEDQLLLRYSKNEYINELTNIEHPIFKQTLQNFFGNSNHVGIELTSIADVPGGTGLGSSGSFGVALQLLLRAYLSKDTATEILAKESTNVEMIQLARSIGLQDQYISAYGGLTEFVVTKNGDVSVSKKYISEDVERTISKNMHLLYVGGIRDAESMLSKQKDQMKENIKTNNVSFEQIIEMGKEMFLSITRNDISNYGKLMHEYWLIKKERQKQNTPASIIDLYDNLYESGLIYGGKLVGAGGGGFLLVATKEENSIQDYCDNKNIRMLPFNLDTKGATIL